MRAITFLVAGIATLLFPAAALAITVNSNADDSPNAANCTLRDAIIAANTDTNTDGCNAGPAPDRIAFASSFNFIANRIQPTTDLPPVTDPVTLDARTGPGCTGARQVVLDGASAGSSAIGLNLIHPGGSTVCGFFIVNFDSLGMEVGTEGSSIRGNRIGVGPGAPGNAEPNGTGVLIEGSSGDVLGGPNPANLNVISGNEGAGVVVSAASSEIRVEGNRIGTNQAGDVPIPNGGAGIAIDSAGSNTVVGNLISSNGQDGVQVTENSEDPAVQNEILGNSIFSNGGLGIDLDDDGVTANDPGDGDSSPNNFQNFPVLTSAQADSADTEIQGSLNSEPSQTYTVEFFTSDACDGSGNGEGQTFLDAVSVTTDGVGNAGINATVAPSTVGDQVTATATSTSAPGDGTSEFSACEAVTAKPGGGGGGGGDNGGGGPGGGDDDDTRDPKTNITKKPKKKVKTNKNRVRVRFRFKSDEKGSKFRCKLDKREWKNCKNPKKYKVDDGRHTFRVRAIDDAGNRDDTPAKFKWKVREKG